MLAVALDGLGEQPTFLIGGISKDLGSNGGSGTGPYYVVEADESDGSFLYLAPYLALVTNIEADHLDFYDGIEHVERTFEQFLARVVRRRDRRRVRRRPATGAPRDRVRLPRGHVRARPRTPTCGCSRSSRTASARATRSCMPDGTVVECDAARARRPHGPERGRACSPRSGRSDSTPPPPPHGSESFAGVRRRFDTLGEVRRRARSSTTTRITPPRWPPRSRRPTRRGSARCGRSSSRTATAGPTRWPREFGEAFARRRPSGAHGRLQRGRGPDPRRVGQDARRRSVLDRASAHRARLLPAPGGHRRRTSPTACAPGDLVLTMGAGDVNTVGVGARARARGARRGRGGSEDAA